jgi:DNA ligase-1
MKTHFKPMLAHKFDNKRVDWSKPVFIQPKLDGIRCIMTADGCYSRNGKKFMNVQHLYTKAIQDLFKANPLLVIDGELYNHDLRDDFEKIVSLVRKQKPKPEDRKEARKLIQYHVYDFVMAYKGKLDLIESDMNRYEKRMHQLVCSDMYGKHIRYVPSRGVHSLDKAKEIHNDFLEKGYEGSILRLDGPYKCGRSYDLMKFKDFSDTEAKIVDWVEGKGKRRGTIGKFIAIDSDGVKFGMPVMDNFEYLQKNFKKMQRYVGKIATFTYFERTKAGSYRHPLFKTIRNYE